MDFMACYDSDDGKERRDNEAGVSSSKDSGSSGITVPKAGLIVDRKNNDKLPTTEESYNGGVKKKKKKLLDISFLPSHIQEALRGEVALDSDPDDIDANKRIHPNVSKPKEKKVDQLDPLLAMLPAPKDKNSALDALFASGSFKPNKVPNSERADKMPKEVEAGEDKPRMDRFDHVPVTTHSYNSAENIASESSHEAANLYSDPATSANNEYAPTINRKKRERELEYMLMSGDLSALSESHTQNMREVTAVSDWDSMKYTEQQQKEADILKTYTAGGSFKAAMQPNKVQNRKHQLSSLALKAAEAEISMLESSHNRSKTKSQTQSRYGW